MVLPKYVIWRPVLRVTTILKLDWKQTKQFVKKELFRDHRPRNRVWYNHVLTLSRAYIWFLNIIAKKYRHVLCSSVCDNFHVWCIIPREEIDKGGLFMLPFHWVILKQLRVMLGVYHEAKHLSMLLSPYCSW